VQLFITDTRVLMRDLVTDSAACTLPSDVVTRTGLIDGVPFILDDDGRYDSDLNRFFRACPTMGVRSPNSLKAYAFDILVWMRFLNEQRNHKSIWQADREDLAAYHAARRRSTPMHRISASSWNRAIAALEKFYGWAKEEELIAVSPFGSSIGWRRIHGGRVVPIKTVRAREPGARRGDLRFVSLDNFLIFRDVGLRGRHTDGLEDSTWYGRHGERNVLFAELLATTGLRLEEAASLLTIELPLTGRDGASQRSLPFRLPAAIAKGGKGREIRLPVRLLRRLADYVAIERAAIVAKHRSNCSDAMIVLDSNRGVGRVVNESGKVGRLRLDMLRPKERRSLVMPSGEPMALWLNEVGRPMTAEAWEAVFRRASARCCRFGIDVTVTPHALRHTFAVHMLSMLIREQIGSVLADGPSDEPGAGVYRRMVGDPLQKLQRLMGHASIASTYIYLDSLEESRALVEAAAEHWGAALDGSADAA
jgi:site-specific recombinase XerD